MYHRRLHICRNDNQNDNNRKNNNTDNIWAILLLSRSRGIYIRFV